MGRHPFGLALFVHDILDFAIRQVMDRSKWTVMLIPHDSEGVRSIQLSSSRVKGVVSILLLTVLLSGVFTAGFFLKQGQHVRAEQLQRENLLLATEVTDMRNEMATLAASITDLAQKDEKYRTIAGLPSIDDDVQRVGIGGPGTASLDSMAVYAENPELGEQIFAASYDLETLIRRATLMRSSMDEALATLQQNTERLLATPSISPSSGHLSSLFSRNRRHPILRITRPHEGIDIAAPIGESILAPAKGKVVFSGNRAGGYGLTVELNHGFGYTTRFAHASRLLVRRGDVVERGEVIAEVGATGLVTGPHLHYEVESDGVAVDPLNFIITDAIPE
ncbi:MAG: peptidoglycan DD-metalloendopeptidase family protein [Gemmatimonas sp.]|nr:peptidoglycan DD-metalloendopeptidase family protein [Gemmatimonas sp.]